MRDFDVAAGLTKLCVSLVPRALALLPLRHPWAAVPRAANKRNAVSPPQVDERIERVEDEANVVVHELIEAVRLAEVPAPPLHHLSEHRGVRKRRPRRRLVRVAHKVHRKPVRLLGAGREVRVLRLRLLERGVGAVVLERAGVRLRA
eukprot:CAMPEP_0113273362 /NCGR_PEP_ID=MMETSP0008_2-20120614/23809_1 /TAXON_ID=97485 /ORGANISM="Prymnesium parvum" /LENGTH=146 /DNA_ID=CAMNT_0000122871 /DNA_START=303 /DNA_END=743 /DNA_ORIENTATION=+ /assembly_acc=CAM_ASM_000153